MPSTERYVLPRLGQIQPTSTLFVIKHQYDGDLPFTRDNLGLLDSC
jgi:hypothetical protein